MVYVPVGGVEGLAIGDPLSKAQCDALCRVPEGCRLIETDAGVPMIECTELAYCEGRRPEGLHGPEVKRQTPLAEHLARAAHLEAASVVAFKRLRDELRRYGAPRRLVRAAGRAAHDEVRHARNVGRLARRHGARVPAVVIAPAAHRSVFEMASENTVEGCARESYGALVKLWQAEHAATAEMRALLARIARDEVRHAALAFAIARWADARLTKNERARIARLGRTALAELQVGARVSPDPTLVRELGLPEPAAAERLVRGLDRVLHS